LLLIIGLIPGRVRKIFSSPQCPDWLWGPQSLLSNGYQTPETLSLGVKWQMHKNEHSPTFSVMVKRAIYPLPHTSSWHGASLIMHRENVTFTTYSHICTKISIIKLVIMIYFNFNYKPPALVHVLENLKGRRKEKEEKRDRKNKVRI
jgi:hypothetical protein